MTLIPKKSTPTKLAEVGNQRHTHFFFSKLLESFLLNSLRQTIPNKPLQLGGIKVTGIDNILCETWKEILEGLEAPNSVVNQKSVDFEKSIQLYESQRLFP